jgi:hypothetical protein
MADMYTYGGLAQGLVEGLQAFLAAKQQKQQWQAQQEERGIINLMRMQQYNENIAQDQRATEQYEWMKSQRPLQQAKSFEELMQYGPDAYKNITASMPGAPAWHAEYKPPIELRDVLPQIPGMFHNAGVIGTQRLLGSMGVPTDWMNNPADGGNTQAFQTPADIAAQKKAEDDQRESADKHFKWLESQIKDKSFFDRPEKDKQWLLQQRSQLRAKLYGKGAPMNVATGQYIEPTRPPMSDSAFFSAANLAQNATDNGALGLLEMIQQRMNGEQQAQTTAPMSFAPMPVMVDPGTNSATIPTNTVAGPTNQERRSNFFGDFSPSTKAQRASTVFEQKTADRNARKIKDELELEAKRLENEKKRLEIAAKTGQGKKAPTTSEQVALRKERDRLQGLHDKLFTDPESGINYGSIGKLPASRRELALKYRAEINTINRQLGNTSATTPKPTGSAKVQAEKTWAKAQPKKRYDVWAMKDLREARTQSFNAGRAAEMTRSWLKAEQGLKPGPKLDREVRRLMNLYFH